MGCRGNIAIEGYRREDKQDCIYFYTHWTGYRVHAITQAALRKRWRWTDNSYLARIIFDELCPERGQETGYGISTEEAGDNEYPLVYVDPNKQEVSWRFTPFNGEQKILKTFTFDEYVDLSGGALEAAWKKACQG